MLVLFETAGGYAIFKLLDSNKLTQSDNLYLDFETAAGASKIVNLQHFHKFEDITEALAATTASVEGKLCKSLKKTLKKFCGEVQEQLAVADAKLGNAIKDKLGLQCISNTSVQELMRCIRSQMNSLLSEKHTKEVIAMRLGLAHSLSRYRLKYSPDKIDTMVIQTIGLLDDLDKELNNYAMRCREWYGWHFPELAKIVKDNLAYVRTVNVIGTRENAVNCDMSDFLPEELEAEVKEAAEMSMGTEIKEDDVIQTRGLCHEILELAAYRVRLHDYVKSRMMALAPNLSVLVGELIGARLMSHAGSLMKLAKHPGSTIQILGAEKALFRALKMKKDTPKYGLIYHSQLVGQASKKNKGKMSRMLAAKAALAIRYDALGESNNCDLGAEHRAKLVARLQMLEEGNIRKISGTAKAKAKFEKYHSQKDYAQYSVSVDSTLQSNKLTDKSHIEESQQGNEEPEKKKKKKKHVNVEIEEAAEASAIQEEQVETEVVDISKKKKKKRSLSSTLVEEEQPSGTQDEAQVESVVSKKKKKKKKHGSVDTETQVVVEVGIQEVQAETELIDLSKKKKKKRKLSSTIVEEEQTSGAQEEIQIESLVIPKKKKKRDREHETNDAIDLSSTQETDVTINKKKKKKFQQETVGSEANETEMKESTDISARSEVSETGQKKKKKKKEKD